MAEFKQIIDDALDILKFDGAVQDTLAELREKWGAQVPALLDERFDAVGVQYMKLWWPAARMKLCFGPIISRKSAAAFCGSKAKFPGGFPARSRKSSKMFGKILSCSHATEEYCWFARPVNPFGGCRRWMESGFRSPWITGVPRVFPSR